MADFWLDTDSLVRPHREFYRFATVPRFWEFLEQKAEEGVIASSQFVLEELKKGKAHKGKPDNDEVHKDKPDKLLIWAENHQDVLFRAPTEAVQEVYAQIAESVKSNNRYAAHWVQDFLGSADPWIIAHAKALGGRVVTFEKPAPNSTKVKIPDVAAQFGVNCITLWDMLSELNASI
jgi:hypothetical protein